MPKLYMILLGGRHAHARIEVHDVAMAVGDALEGIYPQLTQAWFGQRKGLHIDAWVAVQGICYAQNDYKIHFEHFPAALDALKLYFVNLGGSLNSQFGEQHRYRLIAAYTEFEAKTRAMQMAKQLWQGAHVDAIYEVDDCLAIDAVDGQHVHLCLGSYLQNEWQNCYIPI